MKYRLPGALGIAATAWFLMFFPATAKHIPFWPAMSASALILGSIACLAERSILEKLRKTRLLDLLLGIALAAAFWLMFWACEKIATGLFGFARPQIDSIYALADGSSKWVLGAILLFLIGPAEELFWRGFVQNRLARRFGAWRGFLLATALYSAIHIWSFNPMLILAAAVIGSAWGLIYRYFPNRLGAIAISHSLWDALAFVFFPF